MEVISWGTMVKTKVGAVSGMITCISIRDTTTLYEITFHDGAKFETHWFKEGEFECIETKKTTIGYK